MSSRNVAETPLVERLVFPGLALLVCGILGYEQLTGSFRPETRTYILVLIAPVALLSLIIAVREVLTPSSIDEFEDAEEKALPLVNRRHVRVLLAAGLAFLCVLLFTTLGYFIAFPIISIGVLLLTNTVSPVRIFAVTFGILLMVHFGFVGLLGLDLPAGALFE